MRHRSLPGVALDASVVALGGAYLKTREQSDPLCETYFAAGGNVFDTAWMYGDGTTERLFGGWIAERGVRNDIVLVGKGAHSPLCFPSVIGPQLAQSLERLRSDRLDVYFIHRDNTAIPVGEFVDAVDAEIRAGRIGAWGCSNWARDRVDAALDYAARHGKRAPQYLSNAFSLAEMIKPVWEGTVGATSPEWRDWLRERRMPNFAWSSQARGFFTDRAGPDKRDDTELVSGWYSERNFARRDRAVMLAEELGRRAIHIALAYCLWVDVPQIPLIGPERLSELEDSLEALTLVLTPEQIRWLESG